ncbi:unnamed protein product [Linum tenue]|uniref:Uncharacterized protein n=1 Tax=Linum tenue TaxID=586396 RepID=A0AAV0NPP9_9ROSI|nr:unnamed protein product [Linum tenue]
MQPCLPSPLHSEMGQLADFSSALPYVPWGMAFQRLKTPIQQLLLAFFSFVVVVKTTMGMSSIRYQLFQHFQREL